MLPRSFRSGQLAVSVPLPAGSMVELSGSDNSAVPTKSISTMSPMDPPDRSARRSLPLGGAMLALTVALTEADPSVTVTPRKPTVAVASRSGTVAAAVSSKADPPAPVFTKNSPVSRSTPKVRSNAAPYDRDKLLSMLRLSTSLMPT